MNRGAILPAHFICGVVLVCAIQGCSQGSGRTSTRTSRETGRADLDDCREVKLSCDLIRDRVPGKPERKYEQLTLEVLPREHLRLLRALEKIEIKSGVPRGQLKYRDIEVRTDRKRRKAWFVDAETSRIVATLDVETGAIIGSDDAPPRWATPDGGVPLELSK